jgi:hypothetical protein
MFLSKTPYQPTPEELILRLIKEELRGRKLFHKLSSLGITENFYYPSFSWLVLNTLGINADDDVICDRYFQILDVHVGKIKPNGQADMQEARAVLSKLLNLKGKNRH